MKIKRIIDLSHKIVPEKEHFKCKVKNFDVTEILPQVVHRKDLWYILGEVTMCSHAGTHIEFPYHHLKEGKDASRFPIERLIGEGIVLNFAYKNPGEAITLEEIKAYDTKLKKGDILLIRTDCDKYYYTDQWELQPYMTTEAVQWLIEKGISCIGTDAAGIEVPGTDYQPNHMLLFESDIPMIESMTNLSMLESKRFLILILPLPIERLDACPVRIIAIEEEKKDE